MEVYFQYGEKETDYLKKADKRLGKAIERIGPVKRTVIPDLFAALVYSIIGQQISTKAQGTVWERMKQAAGELTPEVIARLPIESLQKSGFSFKKAAYIQSAAEKIVSGAFDIRQLQTLPDEEVCAKLSELKGVGQWTAEMLMIFSMQRPDILSFHDLAIIRGLRMLYGHRTIDKDRFERYKKRYSPYGSVASLYLWEIAGGQYER